MTKGLTHFSALKPCRFLVTLNPLFVPSSSIVVSYWVVMLIVVVSSMLLDVTTFGTSTPLRFETIEVGEVRFTTTSSLFSNCFRNHRCLLFTSGGFYLLV